MEHLAAAELVEQEASALADLLVTERLAAPVPTCPGWSLADLARHTSGVHRWATSALATAPRGDPGGEPAGPGAGAALPAWFAEGAHQLLAALHGAEPTAPCWTFAAGEAPATAAFWSRRMLHETAVHRWDAEVAAAAAGARPAPDPATWRDDDTAADGVAEVVGVMLPRQVRLGRTAAVDGTVALVDAQGRMSLLGGPPAGAAGRAPVAVVFGPAPVLQLLLWRRTRLEREVAAGRLAVDGDSAAATAVLGGALTP